MRKLILVLSLLILSSGLVNAESTENVTKKRPERAAEIQEIRQEFKSDKAELKEELKEKFQEFRSQVAENHALRLEKRFNFYFKRLSNIISRFEKRLAILKSSGKDIASIQAKLDSAKSKLDSAKLKGEEAVTAFKAIDPAKFSEQKTEARAARDLAIAARGLFKETHALLKDALKSLKALSKPALPAASSAVGGQL